jgi:hypothetical protein
MSGLTVRVGAATLAWGLLMRDDVDSHEAIWYVLQLVGLVLVTVSLPVYGWYMLTKGHDGSHSHRVLPSESQISRLLASLRKK